MKKILFFLGCAAALTTLTHCSKDAAVDEVNYTGSVKLTASVGETRTSLDGNSILWSRGDQLGLFCGTKFENALFTTNDDQTGSAEFLGDPTNDGGTESNTFYAYYPYSASAAVQGTVISGLSLPALQTYSAKSFGNALNPMAVTGADYHSLPFGSLGAVLKFQITGKSAVTKLELKGNGDEALAGNYSIDFSGNLPTMVFEGADKTMTLTCSDPVQLDETTPVDFHFVLPAGLTFAQGITVKVYTDGSTEPMVKAYANPLTTRANKLITVKAFTHVVPVASVDEANQELANGASGVTITEEIVNENPVIEIPDAFNAGASTTIIVEQPVSKPLTISEASTSGKELPAALALNMNTTADLTVDTPNLTVSLDGTYANVVAKTAENTLIIGKDAKVGTLTVQKGNVKIYGTVDKIVNECDGTISRCINSQDDVARVLADEHCSRILIENSVGVLDFGGESTLKPVIVEADATITNLTVSPAADHPLTISGDDVTLVLEGVKLVCNAPKTYAVNCVAANPDVTVKDSEIIAYGTDCRGVSVLNGSDNKSAESFVTLDNTQIRTTTDPIGNREYTAEEISYFTSRVADGNYYPRGISVGTTGGPVTIDMKNGSSVEGFFYAVNIAGIVDPVTVRVEDSRLDGRAALNVHGQKCVFEVNRSTLIGRNYFGGPTEDFATIVLDRAVATSHSNTVTVTDSEIYSYNKPQTATNHQYSADIRSLHNTFSLKGSTKLIEVGTSDYPARMNFLVRYDNATDNVVNVDSSVMATGKEGAHVLPATVWDGKTVCEPAADADGDFPIYEAAELAWISQQINTGNYLYLTAKGRYAQVYLQNNIDLNNQPWTPMGCQNHSFSVSGVDKCGFYGEFEGTNHVVSNLNVSVVADAKGFIGKTLGKESSVKNLTLRNVSIPKNDSEEIQGKWVGALVGCMDGDTNLSNCHVENVTVYAPGMYRVGGLVGVWTNTVRQNATATVENCSVTGATLTAGYAIGGLMGTVQPQKPTSGYNTISNCQVKDIAIVHKDQYCWDPENYPQNYYPETGHYCYSSAPFTGDTNNVNLTGCTVEGTCTIMDADLHNTYMSAVWTKLPYMGEVGGNVFLNGQKVVADATPAGSYFVVR